LNYAINEVLNRVHAATPLLPPIVQKLGINVSKSSTNFLLGLYFYNDGSGSFNNDYMGNYIKRTLFNDLNLVPGVGRVQFYANTYAVRVWMNLNAMNPLNITPAEISNAIMEQNHEFTIGKSNARPIESGYLTFNVTGSSMYSKPQQFENIIIRANKTQIVRLKDIARVELGSNSYQVIPNISFLKDKQPSHNEIAFMQVMMDPYGNQLEVRNRVIDKLNSAAKNFPVGMHYRVMFDGTKFVTNSINNVIQALIEAFILVALVVFLFLQNIRASFIALITVPISIIGSFAMLSVFGFSINTLSLFAMILAIGIVVDDSIIVVENIERLKETEQNIHIKAIVELAMKEVYGAIIAIALVLSVVFLPVMVLPGMSGVLYRQFAVTIACTVLISAVTALTTTPAICVLLLKYPTKHNKFSLKFYKLFDKLTNGYLFLADKMIKWGKWGLLTLVLAILMVIGIFRLIPTSFIPNEDQGFLIGAASLPSSSSLQDSKKVANSIASDILKLPAVDQMAEIIGVDFFGGGVNSYATTFFVSLKDWQSRQLAKENVNQVVGFINSLNAKYKDARIMAFNLPPIPGLGTTGGIEFYLEGRTVSGLKELDAKAQELEKALMQHKEIRMARHLLNTNSEQILVEADVAKTKFYGVKVVDVYNVLHYIYSNFNVNFAYIMQGLVWVILQGEYNSRKTLKNIDNMYVRNNKGNLVSIASLVKSSTYKAPLMVERFNDYLATQIIVIPNYGSSSGDVMNIIKTEMSNTAKGYDYEWVGSSYMQTKSQKTSQVAFIFAFLMIYLVLCALYEMWRLPLVVLMVVPFALLGSGLMLLMRQQPNDLYFQISLITLLGLSAKNIILLIEFALQNLN
ncbi:MAG: efflux RND transporter permease subunit, partial [Burkholderiales bacterium]|nr:efflux RND transporter permease subunit [Burkholderiales bacterium]